MRYILIIAIVLKCSLGFSQDSLDASKGETVRASLTTCSSRSERNKIYARLMDSVRLTMAKAEIKRHYLYLKGKADAKNGYKAHGGMFVYLTTYGVPFYLWSKPWRLNILNSPHSHLLNNPLYYAGYMKGVERKKAGKLLLGVSVFGPLSILLYGMGIAKAY